jgi:putative hydrolase of the HAD superfamily
MQERLKSSLDNIAVWVFDLDNTLYPAHCDLGAQLGQRMGAFVARFLNLVVSEIRRLAKIVWVGRTKTREI